MVSIDGEFDFNNSAICFKDSSYNFCSILYFLEIQIYYFKINIGLGNCPNFVSFREENIK